MRGVAVLHRHFHFTRQSPIHVYLSLCKCHSLSLSRVLSLSLSLSLPPLTLSHCQYLDLFLASSYLQRCHIPFDSVRPFQHWYSSKCMHITNWLGSLCFLSSYNVSVTLSLPSQSDPALLPPISARVWIIPVSPHSWPSHHSPFCGWHYTCTVSYLIDRHNGHVSQAWIEVGRISVMQIRACANTRLFPFDTFT